MSMFNELITGIINFLFGMTFLDNSKDIITQYAFGDNIINQAIDVNELILPIASVLVCIYFIMEMMDKITHENFSTDQFITLLIKLVFSIMIIENATEIASYIMEFGAKFTDGILSNLQANDFVNIMLDELNFFESIAMFVIMLIPFLFTVLIQLILYFFVFGYALEVNIRSALAPLGFADLISGGSNSNGMRYLKKLLAISIQGGIMLIILSAGSALCADVVNASLNIDWNLQTIINMILPVKGVAEGAGTILKVIGCQLAMVGMLGSARTISNDLIG